MADYTEPGREMKPELQPEPDNAWQALRRDVPSLLLACLLLLVPLYRTRVLEDSFNTPKLALVLVLGVLTAIGLLARPGSARMRLQWYPAPWLMVGLAVWQGMSVFWADSKPLGVDGTVYFATFAVLGWLFYRGPRSFAGLRGMFWAGTAAAIITAAWVLKDDFWRGGGGMVARLPDWRGYLAAGLGNSGHIAGMVGMFLPWVLFRFLWRINVNQAEEEQGPHRGKLSIGLSWLLLPGIAVMFAAMAVTWSVGSAGATIASLVIWSVIGLVVMARSAALKSRISWTRLAAVILAGLAVLAFYFTPNPANPHKPTLWGEAFGSDRWEAGWPTRLVIWKTTWQMIEKDPMMGMGTGNFTYNYVQQVVPSVIDDPALAPYSGAFTNDAHNDYLQLWAEGGVVALALWIAVLSTFFMTIAILLQKLRDEESTMLLLGAGAGMTVFALDGIMSFPMRLPAHFAMAMFFMSVPGVVRRLSAEAELTEIISSDPSRQAAVATVNRRYSRRLRTGGVGILLTLAACVWHHGHRVVAEFYLKAGRSAADTALVNTNDQVMPAWFACDAMYQQTLQAIAAGAPREVWQSGVDQMTLMASPPLNSARELFEKSQSVDRWYANASSRLGQLLLFQGEFAEARAVGRRTLKTLEAYEIHERMGAAAFLEGRMSIAKHHWTICLTRRPEQEVFYRALLERVTDRE